MSCKLCNGKGVISIEPYPRDALDWGGQHCCPVCDTDGFKVVMKDEFEVDFAPKAETPEGQCPTCGNQKVKHKHGLTPGLVNCLLKLAYAGGSCVKISEALNHNEINNFQKLQYWDLVCKSANKGSGYWSITQDGIDFLNSKQTCSKSVSTINGEVVDYSNENVCVGEVAADGKYWDEYEDYVKGMEVVNG